MLKMIKLLNNKKTKKLSNRKFDDLISLACLIHLLDKMCVKFHLLIFLAFGVTVKILSSGMSEGGVPQPQKFNNLLHYWIYHVYRQVYCLACEIFCSFRLYLLELRSQNFQK